MRASQTVISTRVTTLEQAVQQDKQNITTWMRDICARLETAEHQIEGLKKTIAQQSYPATETSESYHHDKE